MSEDKPSPSSSGHDATQATSQPPPAPEPYTTWSTPDRRLLVLLLGYLSLASSLTANIYFPLINLLSDRYDVSVQDINLTITLFMVFQGVAPSFWSPLADSWGRRPVYMATFAVYTLASLGLPIVDRSYPGLLILRALQSTGGSAVLALAYAVVADVTLHSERGRFTAPMMTAANIGPCIGPVIGGGVVLASGDPRWCFRVLLIFGASAFLLIGWTLPETGRNVVGNGAVRPKGIWRTWWSWLFAHGLERSGTKDKSLHVKQQPAIVVDTKAETPSNDSNYNKGKTGRGKLIFPNPFSSLRIVFYPDAFLTLWLAASPYAFWFCIQTSITPIFAFNYGFNPLYVGLCFLAGGVGIIAGGFVAGRLRDANYKHTAQQLGISIDRARGENIAEFPIERARSRGSVLMIVASLGAVIGYGWIVEKRLHPAVPLIFQAYIGCRCTVLHQTYSALIVDIFPGISGTAAASNNITRCTLAALAVAVMNPLINAIGYGWVFTLLGLIDAVFCIGAVLALRRWGRQWRAKRLSSPDGEAGS